MESDNIKASVQERFERAKQEQERIKEEKIRQLKTLYINTNNSNDQEHTQRQAAVQSLQEKLGIIIIIIIIIIKILLYVLQLL
jgi:hypothetical protein